jgi:hypothetical protein
MESQQNKEREDRIADRIAYFRNKTSELADGVAAKRDQRVKDLVKSSQTPETYSSETKKIEKLKEGLEGGRKKKTMKKKGKKKGKKKSKKVRKKRKKTMKKKKKGKKKRKKGKSKKARK